MDKVLITGANRGIGFELVRQNLGTTDAIVFATCRNPDNASGLKALKADYPERLYIIQLEVTNQESLNKAVIAVREITPVIDVLINNAGINGEDLGSQDIRKITQDLMRQVFDINIIAPVMVVQAFLALVQQSQHGRIINMSSEMGSISSTDYGGYYAYSTSKAAVNMISRMLSNDLPENITTIALDPGWVQTDMGGSSAPLLPIQSATGIIQVINSLTHQDNGSYLRWNGDTLPW